MERLSGIDAAFTYLETPNAHMHVAMTAIFDTDTMPGGYSFDAIRRLIAERMPVSYTHLRAHETPEHLVCRLLLEKKNRPNPKILVHFNIIKHNN